MVGIRTCDREPQVQRPNHYTTEPPAANLAAVCGVEADLLELEVSTCADPTGSLSPFSYGDLDLDPMTYELDPYSLQGYIGCADMNFLRQGFRKLSSDRQTDRRDQNYIPRRFAGGQQ